jgi:hypothetical protein
MMCRLSVPSGRPSRAGFLAEEQTKLLGCSLHVHRFRPTESLAHAVCLPPGRPSICSFCLKSRLHFWVAHSTRTAPLIAAAKACRQTPLTPPPPLAHV